MTPSITSILVSIDSFLCDTLQDLVPFEQFKKREKHLRTNFTFRQVAGLKPAMLLKLAFLHGCFSRFLNCINDTKSRKKHNKYLAAM